MQFPNWPVHRRTGQWHYPPCHPHGRRKPRRHACRLSPQPVRRRGHAQCGELARPECRRTPAHPGHHGHAVALGVGLRSWRFVARGHHVDGVDLHHLDRREHRQLTADVTVPATQEPVPQLSRSNVNGRNVAVVQLPWQSVQLRCQRTTPLQRSRGAVSRRRLSRSRCVTLEVSRGLSRRLSRPPVHHATAPAECPD